MSYLTAKDIAKETGKLNESFSQVMNLAINLAEEKDRLQVMVDSLKPDRQRLKQIISLLSYWEQGKEPEHHDVIDHAGTGSKISDFNILRHIQDVIIKGDV